MVMYIFYKFKKYSLVQLNPITILKCFIVYKLFIYVVVINDVNIFILFFD